MKIKLIIHNFYSFFFQQLKYVLNTHVHADHITGSGEIKSKLRNLQSSKEPNLVLPLSVISKTSGAQADLHVVEGDVISIGSNVALRVLSTPGKFFLKYFEMFHFFS